MCMFMLFSNRLTDRPIWGLVFLQIVMQIVIMDSLSTLITHRQEIYNLPRMYVFEFDSGS